MEMTEFLEKDKETLLANLKDAGSREQALSVVSGELDRLLLQYNENCASLRGRESSSGMIQAARSAVSLLDADGEPLIWEHPEPDATAGKNSAKAKSAVTMSMGIVCGAAGIVVGVFPISGIVLALSVILTAAGLGLMFLAGCQRARPSKGREARTQKVEVPLDPEKIYRTLHTLTLVMDQNLREIEENEAWEEKKSSALSAGTSADSTKPTVRSAGVPAAGGEGMSEDEIELFARLLEAQCSADGEYALSRLGDVRFYLHQKGLEAVDYDGTNAELFDLMPGSTRATIRPALVSSGRLVKKGLAAGEK